METRIKSVSGVLLVLLILRLVGLETVVSAQSEQLEFQIHSPKNLTSITAAELPQFSLIKALTLIAKDQDLNSLCSKELQLIKNEFLEKRPWAMKVVDATGVRPPGFLHGQNVWIGSRYTCENAQNPVQIGMSDRFQRSMEYGILNETAPFDVRFKIAYLDFETPWQVDWRFMQPEKTIIWGLCLPASCSIRETEEIMRFYIKSDFFVERKFLGINATLAYVKDLGLDWSFFELTSVRISIGVISFTIIMIVAAMLRRLKFHKPIPNTGNANFLFAFIGCFDAKDNLEKIFDDRESEKDIKVISGIRTINANCIIFLHILLFAIFTCVNRTKPLERFGRGLLGLFSVAVEAFFVISGFLLTYNFLKNRNQRLLVREAKLSKIPLLFLKKLFHRWLRLAPIFYIVVCLNTALHAFIYAVSVYKLPAREDLLMVDTWWRYLLFINNFQNFADFAVSWSWSMACEIQFFVIGMALLFVYARNPGWGKRLYLAVFAMSVISYFYNGITSNFSWQYDAAVDCVLEMYFHTLVRITAYLSGMLTAWYIVEKPFALHHTIERGFGYVSLALFTILLSPFCDCFCRTCTMSVLLLLLIRLLKAFWNCWLILNAVRNRHDWLTSLFELKLFQTNGRLSYGIYLINPLIVMTIASLTNMGFLFDWTFVIICTAGTIFLSKWLAVIFSLVFELPYSNLSTLLLRPDTAKKAT